MERTEDEHQSENHGHQSEAKFQALFQQAAEGLLIVDESGMITEANHQAESIFGYPKNGLNQQPLNLLIPHRFHADHDIFRENYQKDPHHRPMGQGMELVARKKDNTEISVEISLSYFRAGGEVLVLAHVTDISRRKLIEKQILHSQKMESLGMLASGITHDFNNVLTVVQACGEILKSRLDSGSRLHRMAEQICNAGEKGSNLVRQVLTFAKKQQSEPRLVDPGELLDNLAGMLNTLVGSRITLQLRHDEQTPQIMIDPSQFEQIVVNLVVNARDALGGSGLININSSLLVLDKMVLTNTGNLPPGRYLNLQVKDDGCGMSPETQVRIFDPFFTTKLSEAGTGLGLSTVYGIVQQYAGAISLDSAVGAGSTFNIFIPVAESSPEGSD